MQTNKILNEEQQRFLEMWEWVKSTHDFRADAELLSALNYKSRSAISEIKAGKAVSNNLLNALCDEYGVSRRYVKTGTLPRTNTDADIPATPAASQGEEIRKRKAYGEAPAADDALKFVPVAAQAGYAVHYTEPRFLSDLETINLPNMPYKGRRYRVFEVSGDSMEPTLREHFHVIGEKIEPEFWNSTAQYYIYVIVTLDQILIKRLFRKDEEHYVLISDNKDFYPQFIMQRKDIKELWLVKRKMDWEMPPPQKVEIEV